MIKMAFLEGQGLGNQLWVYAALRGISKKLDVDFYVENKQNFKGKDFLNIDFGNKIDKKEFKEFKEKLYFDSDLNYYASGFDERVKDLYTDVEIKGLFQSELYIDNIMNNLGEIILLSDEMKEYSKKFNEKVIINLRGGEYKRHKNLILPKSYWLNAIEKMKEKDEEVKFLIVTDDPNYAKSILPEYEILKAGVAECYAALYGAKKLIVSNSSFSYFPIKTRKDLPFVIAPYQWSRFDNSYNRWAAPVNYYDSWNWLNSEGEIINNRLCKKNAEETSEFYNSSFNIHVAENTIKNKFGFPLVSSKFKKPIKKILSKVFPEHIG